MSEDICDRLVRFDSHKKCLSSDLEVEAAAQITRLRKEYARLWARICEADEIIFNQARTIQGYQDAAIREGGKND